MDPQKTGDYIKRKRMAKAITQEEIAYRLGVSKNTVSRWERGINLPDYKVLSKLAEQLDTEADEILRGEDSFSSADRNYESSEADYILLEKLHKISNQKTVVIIIFIINTVIFSDVTYGYFATKLSWDINEKIFKPKGIVFSLIYDPNSVINVKGVWITRLFHCFIAIMIIEIFMVIVLLILTERENRNKKKIVFNNHK